MSEAPVRAEPKHRKNEGTGLGAKVKERLSRFLPEPHGKRHRTSEGEPGLINHNPRREVSTPHPEVRLHKGEKIIDTLDTKLFKGRFALAAAQLIESNQLPKTDYIQQRLKDVPNIHLIVTNDPKQAYAFFDPERNAAVQRDLSSDLHTIHELTHGLLPIINWKPLNEAVTQKVAHKIDATMKQHLHVDDKQQPTEDFFISNQEFLPEIERITGLSLTDMLAIASDPAYADDVAAEINNRWKLQIDGMPTQIGIIDCGKHLEGEGYDIIASDTKKQKLKQSEKDEFVANHILEGFRKIPSRESVGVAA